MKNWNERNKVKIGDIGEDMIKDYLEKKGYIIYKPISNCSHPIDIISFNNTDSMSFNEVKVKPRRWRYNDTGVDLRSWRRYVKLINEYKTNLNIYFIDEYENCIYSIFLNDIYKNGQYKVSTTDQIVYFDLEQTQFIRFLTHDEIELFKDKRDELNQHIPAMNEYNFVRFFTDVIIKEKEDKEIDDFLNTPYVPRNVVKEKDYDKEKKDNDLLLFEF